MLPLKGPDIKTLASLGRQAPAFKHLPSVVNGWACTRCDGLFCKKDSATKHLMAKHQVSIKVDRHQLRELAIQQVSQGHWLEVVQPRPTTRTASMATSASSTLFFSAESSGGPVGTLADAIPSHRVSRYALNTFGFTTRLTMAPPVDAPPLRLRLVKACAPDGRFDQVTRFLFESLCERFCGADTVSVREAFVRHGAHGNVAPATRRKYCAEFSRFVGYVHSEHQLVLPVIKSASASDHGVIDEAVGLLFSVLQAPFDLAGACGAGSHPVMEYLAIRHLNAGSEMHLAPAAMTAVVAALKWGLFVLTVSAFSLKSRAIAGQLQVSALPDAVGLQPVVDLLAIPKASSAASTEIAALQEDYRKLFTSPSHINNRLSLIMRAARAVVRSEPNFKRSVEFASPECTTEVSLGDHRLSWILLENLVRDVTAKIWQDMGSALDGLVIPISHRDDIASSLVNGSVQDGHISSSWGRLFERADGPLVPVWKAVRGHLDQSFLTINNDYKSEEWQGFLDLAERVNQAFFLLILITGGPPKRGAEIANHRIKRQGSDSWSDRTIFIKNGTIAFQGLCSKTSSSSGKAALSWHFLPPEVAAAFLFFLVVIRSIERRAASVAYQDNDNPSQSAEAIAARYATELFVARGRTVSVAKLNAEFRSLVSSNLDQGFGVQDYRQLAVALGNPVYHKLPNPEYNSMWVALCGHSRDTHDRSYAVLPTGESIFSLALAMEVCFIWHKQLGFRVSWMPMSLGALTKPTNQAVEMAQVVVTSTPVLVRTSVYSSGMAFQLKSRY